MHNLTFLLLLLFFFFFCSLFLPWWFAGAWKYIYWELVPNLIMSCEFILSIVLKLITLVKSILINPILIFFFFLARLLSAPWMTYLVSNYIISKFACIFSVCKITSTLNPYLLQVLLIPICDVMCAFTTLFLLSQHYFSTFRFL